MTTSPPQATYPDQPRHELVPFVPAGVASVLDVGCGKGGFGAELRRQRGPGLRLVGVEAVSDEAVVARERHGFDRVIDGYFPEALAEDVGLFDLITFNDVLEHTVDPWAVLAASRAFLSPSGRVMASIPSIQFAPIVAKLITGRWDYTDDGILDRTHLRFFTKATMIGLFEQAGFTVEVCTGINQVGQVRELSLPRITRTGLRVGRRLLGNSQYAQFVVIGRPSTQG